MKLLPRLYSPTEGNIMIDNYDIDKVELYSLRRQIGIVPQEPLLFTGSVSDNIALTDPNASSEEIEKAARVSCSHEFIMGLPYGYSTELGERGANLSGGQRQRLAIARTLLANPNCWSWMKPPALWITTRNAECVKTYVKPSLAALFSSLPTDYQQSEMQTNHHDASRCNC